MDHTLTPAASEIVAHLRQRFDDREVVVEAPAAGPIHKLLPDFHVVRIRPRADRPEWLYVTASLWPATQRHGHALEFALLAPTVSAVHVETVTMVAYYHANGGRHELDHGHTVPIGRPWVAGSKCRYLLVSLPYLWGEQFEICPLADGHARILWLLPITKAEKSYRHSHGLEALEQRLENPGIIPDDPFRDSVVEETVGPLRRAVQRLTNRSRRGSGAA